MELKHEKANYEIFSIVLTVDHLDGSDELSTFKSILTKLYNDSKKPGFKTKFTIVERDFITEMYLNCVGEDEGPNVTNL